MLGGSMKPTPSPSQNRCGGLGEELRVGLMGAIGLTIGPGTSSFNSEVVLAKIGPPPLHLQ